MNVFAKLAEATTLKKIILNMRLNNLRFRIMMRKVCRLILLTRGVVSVFLTKHITTRYHLLLFIRAVCMVDIAGDIDVVIHY